MSELITKQLLQKLSALAVKNASNGDIDGMCDPVSIELCRLLETRGYQTNGIASVRFLGTEPHYVAVLNGAETEFSNAEYVIVDPTITQFSALLPKQVDEVVCVASDDSRWDDWYPEFELITDRRVTDFRATL